MAEGKNIIIFNDFSVFSSYPKEITKDWLQKSAHFLTTYTNPFPVCTYERILITVTEINPVISSIFITSPMEMEHTIDMLEKAIDLLETNEADFFCPDESF